MDVQKRVEELEKRVAELEGQVQEQPNKVKVFLGDHKVATYDLGNHD